MRCLSTKKSLADANRTALFGRKTRSGSINESQKILTMITELRKAYALKQPPEGTTFTVGMVNELLTRMELRLDELEKEIEITKRLSLNPAKQQRRTLKSQVHKLNTKQEKLLEHQTQFSIYGTRNSYSKTDYDAIFMRIKEEHMKKWPT